MASANFSEPAQRTPFKFGEYIAMDVLGEGAYGTVARCFHSQTLEVVAVKVIKDPSSNVRNEVEMLRALNHLQPDKYNIVRFINYFRDHHARCLAFETLDKSLDNMINQRSPLNLKEIRLIAQQLLVALDGLKTAGIIHADLKPDNVMLVNHNLQPYKVKLIDFGLSGYSTIMDCNTIGQPYTFMAPEATLGYKEYLLSEGYMDPVIDGPLERFYTLESLFQGSCTDEGDSEYRDRMAFADLMKRLLDMDPETRITPREALHHCFLMMEHLVGDDSEYSEAARGIMAVVLKDSDLSDLSPPTSPNLQVPQAVPEVENPASSVTLGEKEGKHIKNVPPPLVVVKETSGTQILAHVTKGIVDPLMNTLDPLIDTTENIQPEICDVPFCVDETSDTQIPESLDRPPHLTHNKVPEDTDPEDSGSAGKSSSKSSSVRRWCKRVASCGRLVGRSVLSYMVSSSPNITGAAVLPMFLWGRLESVVNKNSRI